MTSRHQRCADSENFSMIQSAGPWTGMPLPDAGMFLMVYPKRIVYTVSSYRFRFIRTLQFSPFSFHGNIKLLVSDIMSRAIAVTKLVPGRPRPTGISEKAHFLDLVLHKILSRPSLYS